MNKEDFDCAFKILELQIKDTKSKVITIKTRLLLT